VYIILYFIRPSSVTPALRDNEMSAFDIVFCLLLKQDANLEIILDFLQQLILKSG
jgi:hypothetical protein